jgi:YHS domain-containing protein
MKKMIMMVAVAMSLFACNQKADTSDAANPAPAESPVILKASLASTKCLPCGDMELEEGAIADTMTVDGKTYGFCSAECKQAFAANPAQYLTQQ